LPYYGRAQKAVARAVQVEQAFATLLTSHGVADQVAEMIVGTVKNDRSRFRDPSRKTLGSELYT